MFDGIPEIIDQQTLDRIAPTLRHNTHPKYVLGHAVEQTVVEYMNHFCIEHDCKIETPSKLDDVVRDIDFYVTTSHGHRISVSIKTQPKCVETGNLMFELKAFSKTPESKGRWVQSWFSTGKPDVYLFCVGEKLYWIPRYRILSYIKRYRFDSFRRLSKKTKQAQAKSTHPHKDSRSGRIALNKLLRFNVAEVLEENFSNQLRNWRVIHEQTT